MAHDEYEDLKNAMLCFTKLKKKYMYFISRSGYEESVKRHAKEDGAILLTMDDLFNI